MKTSGIKAKQKIEYKMPKRANEEKPSPSKSQAKRPRRQIKSPVKNRTRANNARKEKNASAESPIVKEEEVPGVVQEEIVYDDTELECVDVENQEDESQNTAATKTPPTPAVVHTTPTKSASKRVPKKKISPNTSTASSNSTAATTGTNNKKSKRRRESGTSSEEERWLTAIETGKIEDVVDDELKKIKNPKLMTARQRAMYERNQATSDQVGASAGGAAGEFLMSLPIGYREREKPQTAEDIQKAQLKNQKRKQQMDEKREKDKKKTMERLLKKQENSKPRGPGAKSKALKIPTVQPMITYKNTLQGAFILLPPDHEFPLQPQKYKDPPKTQLCSMPGCRKPKAYNDSRTQKPLCSLECYRKNALRTKA